MTPKCSAKAPRWRCPNDAVPGKTKCQLHLDQDAARQKKRRGKKKEQGLCTDCGDRPPVPGRGGRCNPCANTNNESYRRWRAKIAEAELRSGALDVSQYLPMSDNRPLRQKLEAIAADTGSPHEAAIARQKLEAMNAA